MNSYNQNEKGAFLLFELTTQNNRRKIVPYPWVLLQFYLSNAINFY